MNNPKAVLILKPSLTPYEIRRKIEVWAKGGYCEIKMRIPDDDTRFYLWSDDDDFTMELEYNRATCPTGECITLETNTEPQHIDILEKLAKHFGGFLNRGDGKWEEIFSDRRSK
jgi:hypothetical protein